jgi:hypothetical protein
VRLLLQFAPDHGWVERARLTYAFRLFCAIYGHDPVLDAQQADTADACVSYDAVPGARSHGKTVRLSNLYKARSPRDSAPPPKRFRMDGESTVLFYSPLGGSAPDWLAEIFEWVSCADEYSVSARDSADRIPFESSYTGRHNLDPGCPYGAVAMQFLQRAVCKVVPACQEQPASPIEPCRHFVINTHDVDFFSLHRFHSAKRLAKNAIVSLVDGHAPRLALRQALKSVSTAATGQDSFDQMPALIAGEQARSVGASYFFIASRRHRRDANYRLDHTRVRQSMTQLVANGMEVGVHGSYSSLDDRDRLAYEFACLRGLGFHVTGTRQHWLRFTMDRLIREVEVAGASYDASVGWPHHAGFRAGACFAFPPYNFEYERAATFIEIPLVMMDQALQETASDEEARFEAAASLLATSRRYGWGGISVLWHPAAFNGCQLEPDIGRLFWKLLDRRGNWNDTWTSAASFMAATRERYGRAGLLSSEVELLGWRNNH